MSMIDDFPTYLVINASEPVLFVFASTSVVAAIPVENYGTMQAASGVDMQTVYDAYYIYYYCTIFSVNFKYFSEIFICFLIKTNILTGGELWYDAGGERCRYADSV